MMQLLADVWPCAVASACLGGATSVAAYILTRELLWRRRASRAVKGWRTCLGATGRTVKTDIGDVTLVDDASFRQAVEHMRRTASGAKSSDETPPTP